MHSFDIILLVHYVLTLLNKYFRSKFLRENYVCFLVAFTFYAIVVREIRKNYWKIWIYTIVTFLIALLGNEIDSIDISQAFSTPTLLISAEKHNSSIANCLSVDEYQRKKYFTEINHVSKDFCALILKKMRYFRHKVYSKWFQRVATLLFLNIRTPILIFVVHTNKHE